MSNVVGVINRDSVITRNSNLPVTRVDDDLVILNIATGRYVGLDDIGRTVWDRIEQPMRVGDLCDALARDFRGDADVIADDVLAFLSGMAAEALISADG